MKVELLGQKIKRLIWEKRERKTFIISKFAFHIGYSHQSLNYWFAGKRKIPREAIPVVAKALKITEEELLKKTIQICGFKKTVNWSKIKIQDLIEGKKYSGLTPEEVKTAILWRNQSSHSTK
jgi:DNA-binding transcriptional regulator YdaS (Cro superfamily)